ncbi:MAG: ATP-binding protein [Burkholderiales bacterium]
MQLNQIWHYPRPLLAKCYLDLLGAGPVSTTSIFAPRRTGKTVFLRQDLTPAAIDLGYRVAYADLWQTRLSPGTALIRGLEEALEPKNLKERIINKVNTPVKKIRAKGEVGALTGELEIELEGAKKEATELALRIEELITHLCAKGPLLLLIDEAQELARSKETELVATALRTAITKLRDKVRVVFTGSSRTQLAHVFSNTKAPLYSVGASIQDFPLLDRGFVKFVVDKFYAATRRRLNMEEACKEFEKFKCQPEPFLGAIVAVMMNPALSLASACDQQHVEQNKAENHEGAWAGLDALQRSLVRLFADNPTEKPFSKTTLTKLAKELGVASLDATSVQFAMRKLGSNNIGSKNPQNLFIFESAPFEAWVRTLGQDENEA